MMTRWCREEEEEEEECLHPCDVIIGVASNVIPGARSHQSWIPAQKDIARVYQASFPGRKSIPCFSKTKINSGWETLSNNMVFPFARSVFLFSVIKSKHIFKQKLKKKKKKKTH